jgi:MATE family multidrug resistance protein
LRLALPSILANLTVPLVGLVDIAVAGHLDASAAALIGGVSIGSLMFDMMYWNFGFLRAGTGGLTAQAYGREDWSGCLDNLRHALAAALLSALALIAVQWPFQKLMFVFVQCSDEVRALALKYFYIRVWAAPATLSLMVMRGWFIGMQDTFSSMLTDIMVNGMNIVASIILALGIPGTSFNGIGFSGIAWGTFIAQYSGLLTAATIFLIKYRSIVRHTVGHGRVHSRFAAAEYALSPTVLPEAGFDQPSGGNAPGRTFTRIGREAQGAQAPFAAREEADTDLATAQEKPSMRQFFSVNGDLFVRSLCLMGVYLAFSAISARFGDTLLAMSSIMMKLMMIFSYFTDGFAFAGEALTGRFYGRKDKYAVSKTVKWTFVWSMGIGLLFVAIYAFAGTPMFRLMTSDNTVVEAAKAFLPWLVIMPLLGCPAFTWDGIYIGATATKEMRDANIGCLIAFFIIWFGGILLFKVTGLQANLSAKVHLLFAAYYTHLIFRSLYQTIKYKPAILGRL